MTTTKTITNTYSQQIFVRLEKFLKVRGDNFTDLARNVYVSARYFYSMKANGSAIGSEVLSRICLFYSDLSADWLLTGRGEMLKSAAMLKKEALVQAKELNRKLQVLKDMVKIVRAIEENAGALSARAEELR
jgi:uncharacterized protein (DUF2225 family)